MEHKTDDELNAFLDEVEVLLKDPETRAVAIASVGADLNSYAKTLSDDDYDTRVALTAAFLSEQVTALDEDTQQFAADVVNELSDQSNQAAVDVDASEARKELVVALARLDREVYHPGIYDDLEDE